MRLQILRSLITFHDARGKNMDNLRSGLKKAKTLVVTVCRDHHKWFIGTTIRSIKFISSMP
jgi:hypothetical protein